MWSVQRTILDDGRTHRLSVDRDQAPVSRLRVLRGWRDDAAFRALFMRALSETPFDAYRWEMPPMTRASVDRRFECVVVDSPDLADAPDVDAFADQFRDADEQTVIEFENLGGDALMVVPTPAAPAAAYPHLAAFTRRAPSAQQHMLWQRVGAMMLARLSDRPVWLSTAGAGVAWLHVRLDDRPKYYVHAPYRRG